MEFIKEVFNLYVEKREFFLELAGQHLMLSFISIIISAIIGIILGIIISENRKLSYPIIGATNFLYTIPSIAILGFLVSVSGVGNTTAIITLSIYGLLPMVTNTYTGIKNIDDEIIEAAKGMGSTNFQILYKIKIPLALPVIFAGFKNMVVMTIALCGIASFIGAGGLGVAIWRGITTNNPIMTFAGSFLISIIALLSDWILRKIEKNINYRIAGNRLKLNKNKYLKKKLLKPILISLILFSLLGFIFTNLKDNKVIVIGSKPTTEEYILSEILAQLIENKLDLEVEIKKGIGGGTANIHPAMEKGEIDLYPEYTGTAWEYVLKNKPMKDKDKLYEKLKEEYKEKYNFNWVGLYGYNSTYALIIDNDFGEDNNIKTYSDLTKFSSNLIFGAEYDFYERNDGYDALSKKYNLDFKSKLDLDIGLKYQGLSSKKVDVINAFSTDAQLKSDEFRILEDDKEFFPSYLAGTVVREETLENYEGLEDVLKLLNNQITEREIIHMNYEVEINKKEDSEVARDFLIRKGLIE